MILTGDSISAVQAMENGLINAIAPKETLIDEAVGLGQRVARFAPEAVEVCIYAVQHGLNTTIDEGLAIEAEAFGKMVPTAALRQGLDDFIAARK
jgi:enoyl-CoA hydratase/carnithine racemase